MKSLTKDLLLLKPSTIVDLFQELPMDEIQELIQWICEHCQVELPDNNVVTFPGQMESLRKFENIFSIVELYKIKQYRKSHKHVA